MCLLASVIALSTATRQPCLQVPSGPWHTYKVGHMTEAEHQASSVSDTADSDKCVGAKASVAHVPAWHVIYEETLPLALPIAIQKHHFRSPPLLQ